MTDSMFYHFYHFYCLLRSFFLFVLLNRVAHVRNGTYRSSLEANHQEKIFALSLASSISIFNILKVAYPITSLCSDYQLFFQLEKKFVLFIAYQERAFTFTKYALKSPRHWKSHIFIFKELKWSR